MLVVAWVPEDWAGSSGQMRVQASEAESDQYHIVVHSPNSMYEEESELLLAYLLHRANAGTNFNPTLNV